MHGVGGGGPLVKLMLEQRLMNAGIGSTNSLTPNPINTAVNSSMIQELEGLPKRLNGRTKY